MTGQPAPVTLAPAVTVIIPVYNSAHTLSRAVMSVLQQSLGSVEVLVVDDASTDGTLDVASRLAEADPRVQVVAVPQNGGKSRAMNQAAAVARGTWIAVLDADDRYLPGRLETLVSAGERNGADLVADNQLHVDDATGEVVRQAFHQDGSGRNVGLADFIAHSNPQANFDFGILKPMVRAEFVRRTALQYFPGAALAEDFYYMLEFFALGGRAWLVHAPFYEWTLPFSPTARRWTSTGAGPWRYDYRSALQTNLHYQAKLAGSGNPAVAALLDRREREYGIMVHYLDAQRALADTRDWKRAAGIILGHPGTWTLLARRVAGRAARIAQRVVRR